MQLIEMRLKNYRRLCEPTTIDFAVGEKNVTIIRAENGSGKTGILMALLFGLFGTVKYDQFQIENDDDVMVSSFLLTDNKTVECEVSIDFLDDECKYTITRKIRAFNNGGKIRQDNNNVITTLCKEGIDTNQTREEIDSFMNNLIGENIRGFLFFDGVKYTELFKQNNGQTKKELKNIIEKMLNINDLNIAISTLNSMASDVGNSSTTPRLEQKLSQALSNREKAKDELDKAEQKCVSQDEKIRSLQENYEKALAKFTKYEKFKNIVEEIREKQRKISTLNEKIKLNIDSLGRSCKDQILYNIYSTFGVEVRDELKNMSKDLHGGIDLIDTILASGKCVCSDRPMSEDERQRRLNFRTEIISKNNCSYSLISKMKNDLAKMDVQGNNNSFMNCYEEIINSKTDISSLEAEINRLNQELPQEANNDITFQNEVTNASANKIASQKFIKEAQNELDNLKSEKIIIENNFKDACDKVNEIEAERAIAVGQGKKYNFYKGAAEKLTKLKDEYLSEAQKDISNRANSYFLKLLSSNDKELIDRLILDDDYSIKVYDKTNREVFGQLSAGQKLIASMAFVMGLTAEASNAKPTCNFPLVMDTPVSNLDSANRASLIKLMPSVVKQWILTPMDTELTDTEVSSFENTGKVGRVYELHKKGIKSVIVPYSNISDLYGGIKHD